MIFQKYVCRSLSSNVIHTHNTHFVPLIIVNWNKRNLYSNNNNNSIAQNNSWNNIISIIINVLKFPRLNTRRNACLNVSTTRFHVFNSIQYKKYKESYEVRSVRSGTVLDDR